MPESVKPSETNLCQAQIPQILKAICNCKSWRSYSYILLGCGNVDLWDREYFAESKFTLILAFDCLKSYADFLLI